MEVDRAQTDRLVSRDFGVWTLSIVPKDPAGNRTAEQIDDATTGASYNNMNQLVSQQAGGALTFKGTVSEPATVTVGGKPATVTVDNRFQGQAVVPSGTGNVAVTATDASGNTRTNTYEVSQSGAGKSFSYDANGNLTSDGSKTYSWDAENRLVEVKQGSTTLASFAYNKGGIRTRKTAGDATTTYLLESNSVVEERAVSGGTTTITKHYQGPGIDNVLGSQDASGVSYYVRDHLGSIRQLTGSAGSVLVARDYDPWGTALSGGADSGWAFTGREWDPEVALYYYRARYYDAAQGRFMGPDPIGFKGGANFYAYVRNRVTINVDPLGLRTCEYVYYPNDDPGLVDPHLECVEDPPPPPPDQCCVPVAGRLICQPCHKPPNADMAKVYGCIKRCWDAGTPFGADMVCLAGGLAVQATMGVACTISGGTLLSYCYLACFHDPCAY